MKVLFSFACLFASSVAFADTYWCYSHSHNHQRSYYVTNYFVSSLAGIDLTYAVDQAIAAQIGGDNAGPSLCLATQFQPPHSRETWISDYQRMGFQIMGVAY